MICISNQLTGFYIRATLALNGLNKPKKANSNSGGVKYDGYCSQLKFTSTKKQKYSLYVQYIKFFFSCQSHIPFPMYSKLTINSRTKCELCSKLTVKTPDFILVAIFSSNKKMLKCRLNLLNVVCNIFRQIFFKQVFLIHFSPMFHFVSNIKRF